MAHLDEPLTLRSGLTLPHRIVKAPMTENLADADNQPTEALERGSGRAWRIFKAETKGLLDDDDDDSTKTPEQRQIDARNRAAAEGDTQTRPEPDDSDAPGKS